MNLLHIFCGLDPRQMISWTALQNSIITRASQPIAICPISSLTYPSHRHGLTPFTWSRFLVPWAMGYQGWAVFMDTDVQVRADIAALFKLQDSRYAAMVVRHPNYAFEDASMILFNCAHPDNRKLTPEFIERGTGLHSIQWTQNVGDLPAEWNHLVMYDPPDPNAKLAHFTQGLPCHPECSDSEFAEDWGEEIKIALSTQPWRTLMGQSVHAPHVMKRIQERQNGSAPVSP